MISPGGSTAPFGYRWQDDVLVPHPEEAPVRKRMYELFVEHRNQRTVARLLNEMGYRTRRGARFTITTVGRWLRDPLAKGEPLSNVTVSLGLKKHRKHRPNREHAFTRVQPIVSEDLWNQANRILDAKRIATRTAGRVQLFAGFTFCMCGQKMTVPSHRLRYVCRRCRNTIAVVELDASFREQLRNPVLDHRQAPRPRIRTEVIIKTKREQLEALSQEKERLTEKMDRVYQVYIDDAMSVQDFRRAYRPLDARRKESEEEILALLGDLNGLRNQHLPWDEILADARDLYAGWQTLELEEKRRCIQKLVRRITVERDNVRIETW